MVNKGSKTCVNVESKATTTEIKNGRESVTTAASSLTNQLTV